MEKKFKYTSLIPFLGPAFVASIAYMDPGNFATNIQAGSTYGYKLLWVILLSNIMAMFLQLLSAKLGLATGQNLAEISGNYFSKPTNFLMWIIAEIGAMATDLAEFLGASIAMNLLFGIPLLHATLITAGITLVILYFHDKNYRYLEIVIGILIGIIALCYALETFFSQPNFGKIVYHSVTPWLGDKKSVYFAVGIIGATVMPHALYLHSFLTQNRIVPKNDKDKLRIFKLNILDVVIAMSLAGLINMSILYMSAATFYEVGKNSVAEIEVAYRTLEPLLGKFSSDIFAISLLISGVSSSIVGTLAGQVIMKGFMGYKIPVMLRRIITIVPSIVVVLYGINPTQALVLSQVILSIVLPLPVITLIMFTSKKNLMGVLVNRKITTAIAIFFSLIILSLNFWLIYNIATSFLRA